MQWSTAHALAARRVLPAAFTRVLAAIRHAVANRDGDAGIAGVHAKCFEFAEPGTGAAELRAAVTALGAAVQASDGPTALQLTLSGEGNRLRNALGRARPGTIRLFLGALLITPATGMHSDATEAVLARLALGAARAFGG